MQQSELNQLMQGAAADAISYVKEEHKQALDGSLDSLANLDKVLSELHGREKTKHHSAEMLFTLSNILGAYIGELFIAHVGGHWQHSQQDETAPFVFVQFQDKEFPFASVCYHKITRDDSISLQGYVKQAMANAMQ